MASRLLEKARLSFNFGGISNRDQSMSDRPSVTTAEGRSASFLPKLNSAPNQQGTASPKTNAGLHADRRLCRTPGINRRQTRGRLCADQKYNAATLIQKCLRANYDIQGGKHETERIFGTRSGWMPMVGLL
jgi:hypothetical protein